MVIIPIIELLNWANGSPKKDSTLDINGHRWKNRSLAFLWLFRLRPGHRKKKLWQCHDMKCGCVSNVAYPCISSFYPHLWYMQFFCGQQLRNRWETHPTPASGGGPKRVLAVQKHRCGARPGDWWLRVKNQVLYLDGTLSHSWWMDCDSPQYGNFIGCDPSTNRYLRETPGLPYIPGVGTTLPASWKAGERIEQLRDAAVRTRGDVQIFGFQVVLNTVKD